MSMLGYPEIKERLYEACLDYLCDEGYTPFIAVYTAHAEFTGSRDSQSPTGFTLYNVGGAAVKDYDHSEEGILFECKISGKVTDVHIPWKMLARIFAREDQAVYQGFTFDFTKPTVVESVPVDNEEAQGVTLIHATDEPKQGKGVRKPFKPKLIK